MNLNIMMKNKKIIIGICFIVLLLAIILVIFNINNNNKINTKDDIIKMINSINKKLENELPSLETKSIDINNVDEVNAYTGLESNKDIEELIVSVPMMTSQAYSVAVIKVKDSANVEKIKQNIYDNINMSRWICVSADKLYITNSGNIIFTVMSDEDTAKSVYNEFKKYVGNKIGKELEKSEENIELPPEMIVE